VSSLFLKKIFINLSHKNGLSLTELLVVLAAGAIVVLGVYSLLSSTLWSYNLQEQTTDMYQNATYTLKRLTEVIMQAGTNLPEKNYDVIFPTPGKMNDFRIKINRKNAKHEFTSDISSTTKVPVDSGNAFKGMDSLVKRDTGGIVSKFKIQNVIITASTSIPDTVVISSPASFVSGDVVYADTMDRYFIDGKNFCYNSSSYILAENIDSLAIKFYNIDDGETNEWKKMISASIYVRAKTASPDPKYKHPVFKDGYRRLALNIKLRLRNKFYF
jgi:prepilin-type N-terminal cleavage/methylation domain-containing protein